MNDIEEEVEIDAEAEAAARRVKWLGDAYRLLDFLAAHPTLLDWVASLHVSTWAKDAKAFAELARGAPTKGHDHATPFHPPSPGSRAMSDTGVCGHCGVDASRPWLGTREAVCGPSKGTQPMWACRFGADAHAAYHGSHEHGPTGACQPVSQEQSDE